MTIASTRTADTNKLGSEATSASTRHAWTDAAPAEQGKLDWRAIIFRGAVAVIVALLVSLVGQLLPSPWTPAGPATPDLIPELHRWHDALMAAYANILVCGSLVAAAWHPRRSPLLVQFVLLATGLLAFLDLTPPNIEVLVPAALIAVLVIASYPAPRALLALPRMARVSRPLLVLAMAVAVPLLLHAWTNLYLKYTDVSEHARHGHWAGATAITLSLALAGLLAASRGPGWRTLGIITGVTYLYFGCAALALPLHDGSWGTTGGCLALLAGLGFLTVTLVEGRRMPNASA